MAIDITYKKIQGKNLEVYPLIDLVINNLDVREFYRPYSEEELRLLFCESCFILHGAYSDEKLVALGHLDVNEEDNLEKYGMLLNISSGKICELGGYLVSPDYRGLGIMNGLVNTHFHTAYEMGFEHVLSTVHPDNIASKSVLEKHMPLYRANYMYNGFVRDVYYKKLK